MTLRYSKGEAFPIPFPDTAGRSNLLRPSMPRSTIAVVDTKRLGAIFGPRDCHLRRIREALSVGVSARGDAIHIEGDDEAVARATEVFEELERLARDKGGIEPDELSRLLAIATGNEPAPRHEPIEVQRPRGQFVPRSAGQATYVQAIREHDIVLCAGPAGSGKTFLAVALAVSALRSEQVRKIVLVRPAVEAGESLGYLPGDLQAKINPYLRPLMDAMREMMDYEHLKRLTEQDIVEMIPLAYMRGRTLNNAFIILDEAQNTTVAQMKMFLTRLGIGSKMVISGDTTQVDLPPDRVSGLVDAMTRLEGITGFGQVRLGATDIVRHPLVQRIVEAYDR